MTERYHRTTPSTPQKYRRVTIDLETKAPITPEERHRLQYDFTATTNMGRAALGCGTEDWTGGTPAEVTIELPDIEEPEPEFPQD